MKNYLIDTNIILRFLTGEPESQAELASQLIEGCESGIHTLRILPLVVAEVVFVLSGKHYAFERKTIARELILFLENPSLEVVDRDALILGLRFFQKYKIDYADAFLAAVAHINGCALASFDQDFKKIPKLDLLIV